MKMVRVIALLCLLSGCLALWPMGSVQAQGEDLLRGKLFKEISGNARVASISYITDGNDGTSAYWYQGGGFSSENQTLEYIFPEPVDIESGKMIVTERGATVTFFNETNHRLGTFGNFNVGKQRVTFPITALSGIKSIRINGSLALSSGSGNSYSRVAALEIYKATNNPDHEKFVIENLRKTTNDKSVVLSWTPVNSTYLQKYNIYQDGERIGEIEKGSSYSINNLEYDKEYTFSVRPVDNFEEEFQGASITHIPRAPDTTPPDIPASLTVIPGNTTAQVKWEPSKAADTAGYWLYLDGKKVRAVMITGTSYNLSGLKMDQEYQVYITAQDTTGNVSEPSETVKFRTKKAVTDSEQEETSEFLLVKWEPTDGAVSYNIYLNGRKVGSVGPNVFEFKITKAMGYRPGALENRAQVKAVFEDGTEGDGSGPGGSIIKSPLNVVDVIKAGFGFLGLFDSWVLLMLAVIFAAIIISYLFHIVKRKPSKPVRRG